ncbi:restriction endonuclease subunit S [Rhodococcus zopfii]|uniref:restriction endonuclease subunit S n=1 Tax=Rhodococcus zopfii TaxID=43772 RepID=UPI0036645953
MSRINDLLTELCPNGVEFKALGEIGTLTRGRRFTKADRVPEGLPSIHYGEIYTHYDVEASEAISHVRVDLAPVLRFAQRGDVIFTAVGETVEDVGKSLAWLGDHDVAVHDDCFIFRSALDPKYVVYFTQSDGFNRPKEAFVARAKMKRLSLDGLAKLRIPVPPLEVQQEIVRTLDHFIELERVLHAELNARSQQYVAYRNMLSSSAYIQQLCPDGLKQVALGSIATQNIDAVRVQPEQTYINLGVKWYGEGVFAREPKTGQEIKGKTLYRVKPGQFIYNRMFVTEGAFGLVPPALSDGVVSNEFPVYDLDPAQVLPEWLLLKFQDPATVKTVAAQATGGTKSRRRWKEDQFEAFVIDLPPLPAQREIVRILSTFSDLKAALKDELAGRRKQYEYYLDRLLNFEEVTT